MWKHRKLKNNICIHGIPFAEAEDLSVVVNAFLRAIGVRVGEKEVEGMYRTKPSANSPGLVVVKFATFAAKLEVMNAKKQRRDLAVSHLALGLPNEKKHIYVHHHLTPHISAVFYWARSCVAEGYAKALWIGSDGINVGLMDGAVKLLQPREHVERLEETMLPIARNRPSASDDLASAAMNGEPTTNRASGGAAPRTVAAKDGADGESARTKQAGDDAPRRGRPSKGAQRGPQRTRKRTMTMDSPNDHRNDHTNMSGQYSPPLSLANKKGKTIAAGTKEGTRPQLLGAGNAAC